MGIKHQERTACVNPDMITVMASINFYIVFLFNWIINLLYLGYYGLILKIQTVYILIRSTEIGSTNVHVLSVESDDQFFWKLECHHSSVLSHIQFVGSLLAMAVVREVTASNIVSRIFLNCIIINYFLFIYDFTCYRHNDGTFLWVWINRDLFLNLHR